MNGSAFFLIYFSKYKELYRLEITTYLSTIKVLDRKSIPHSFFDEFEPIRSKTVYYLIIWGRIVSRKRNTD